MEALRITYQSTITAGQFGLGEAAEDIFNLSVVKGLITTSQQVTLAPFEMQTVDSVSKVTGHASECM